MSLSSLIGTTIKTNIPETNDTLQSTSPIHYREQFIPINPSPPNYFSLESINRPPFRHSSNSHKEGNVAANPWGGGSGQKRSGWTKIVAGISSSISITPRLDGWRYGRGFNPTHRRTLAAWAPWRERERKAPLVIDNEAWTGRFFDWALSLGR